MIDRRQLVTSLAAVAAGVTVPSLRTSAAPVVSTGVTFRLGTYAYGWSEAISDTASVQSGSFRPGIAGHRPFGIALPPSPLRPIIAKVNS